jgi:hypothetical protein
VRGLPTVCGTPGQSAGGSTGIGWKNRTPENSDYVPVGTFKKDKNFFCKLLILIEAFWTDQWNQ